jgi:hypothetical protein
LLQADKAEAELTKVRAEPEAFETRMKEERLSMDAKVEHALKSMPAELHDKVPLFRHIIQ